MNYNTNVECVVKLTSYGIKVWRKYYTTLGLDPSDYKFNFIDKAKTELQGPLWEIMHIFGPIMYMGNETPFVKNEIKILEGE